MSPAESTADRPIRIAHVITKLAVGGAQESVLVTCQGLGQPSFAQVVLTGPEFDREGTLLEVARRAGTEIEVVPALGRAVRPQKDLAALVYLVGWMRRWRPDIVHTHSSKAGLLGRLAARVAGVPVVIHSVHGWSFHDGMHRSVRRVVVAAERVAARSTTWLVVEATPDLYKGREAGIGRADQYRLIRNGIDVAAFTPLRRSDDRSTVRADLGLAGGGPVIGTVGRLAAQKDPITMIEAFAETVAAVPEARFVWVGDGPLRAEAEALVRRRRLDDHWRFAGVRRDVARVLGALDAFALSSRWEGLPRTVVEAMAAGVPVVATAVDGLAEVIDPGVNGLLVPPGDSTAIARALVQTISDRDLARSLRAAAATTVEGFDRGEMLRRLDDLYRGSVAA